MQRGVRLSFCIPVYNFGPFLGETLDSILRQCSTVLEEVEILVVDGASTDNTENVVTSRAAHFSQLRYLRLAKRGGIDADLAESVLNASGEYCWLFSGDDALLEGAIDKALRWLRQDHDVYVCKHLNCDIAMNVRGEHPVFRKDVVRVAELSEPQQRVAYMSEGITSEAVFSFMSGLIVRRKKWLSVDNAEEFMGSCWAHVARLFTIAQTQLRVCYVAEPWLCRRGENDSFRDRGLVHRLGIAVDGYHRIADQFFGCGSLEAVHIRRMVRNDIAFRWWIQAKNLTQVAPNVESRRELDRLVDKCYGDPGLSCWLARTAYRHAPIDGYRLMKWIYENTVKRRRATA